MTIVVTYPQGGEVWTRGQIQDIRWTSTTVGNIKIELYKGGAYLKTLASSTANDGLWTWSLSETASDSGSDYKIKITNTSDGSYGMSASVFTINPAPIIVTQPVGGEVWTRGETHDIKWTNTYTGGNVKIDLYKNEQLSRVLKTAAENTGVWTWNLTESSLEVGTGYKIRITNNSDGTFGTSVSSFTIKAYVPPPIVVTYPQGGETFIRGKTYDIRWTSTTTGGNVKIELYKGGTYLKTLISSTANDGLWTWSLSETAIDTGTDFKIKIIHLTDATTGTSAGNFTINPAPMRVTQPVGGEVWTRGETHDIKWVSTTSGGTVKIQLLKDETYLKTLITDTSNDGLWTWALSETATDTGTGYKIKIIHNTTGDFGISASKFTINPAECSTFQINITVT